MIRTLCLFLLLLSAVVGAKAQTEEIILTVDSLTYTRGEFEEGVRKSNHNAYTTRITPWEYYRLYKESKLKLAEAYSQRLDTLPSFIREWEGYKQQLAEPYLTDEALRDRLVEEAYERMKENVQVAHILIRLPQNPTPADTLAAYQKAQTALYRISNGESFEKVARAMSEDQSVAQNGGELGYITALATVYPFENGVYATPVGSVSAPVRTQYGYHLIKVLHRRADIGEVQVAHILKMIPSGAGEAYADSIRRVMDGLYKEWEAGAAFEKLAAQSDDRQTASQGGQLPYFGAGRMVKEFEQAAFALAKPGDVSKPVKTPYGIHLIKLLDKRGLLPLNDKRQAILDNFQRDGRAEYIRNKVMARWKSEDGFIEHRAVKDSLIAWSKQAGMTDSVFVLNVTAMTEPLFELAGQSVYATELVQLLQQGAAPLSTNKLVQVIENTVDGFIDFKIAQIEEKLLPQKYPAYAALVEEYKEGLLIFEISNREVWDKAAKDTVGLKNYFVANRKEYKWDQPRFKGWAIQCSSKEIEAQARKLAKQIHSSDSLGVVLTRTFNTDSTLSVKCYHGLFQKGQNRWIDKAVFKEKKIEADPSMPYLFTVGKLLKSEPEEFTDVLGAVISDYQQELDRVWVEKLRRTHRIVENNRFVESISINK